MTATTAKVVCSSANATGEGADRRITANFQADYKDGRNKEWAHYTPSVSVTMTLRGDLEGRFEAGKSYTLTFTPEEGGQ